MKLGWKKRTAEVAHSEDAAAGVDAVGKKRTILIMSVVE